MALALDANAAAHVFIIGRRAASLEKIASRAKNGRITPVVGDVTSKESLQSCTEQISQIVNHVDVLVANSGIAGPPIQPKLKPDNSPHSLLELRDYYWNVPMTDYNHTLAVNVTGVFYSAIAMLPLLEAANKIRKTAEHPKPLAQIITTSSIGGFTRQPGAGIAYAPSKAAVTHLTKQLATMFSEYDIRANVIAPGIYLSELTSPELRRLGADNPSQEGSFPKDYIPMSRSGTEEDIAGVVLWLCSRAGAYINGNVVVTDGGRLSILPATY